MYTMYSNIFVFFFTDVMYVFHKERLSPDMKLATIKSWFNLTTLSNNRVAVLAGYYWICSDIFVYFLNLSNFRVAKINGE